MSDQQHTDDRNDRPTLEELAAHIEERMKDPEFLQSHMEAYERAAKETKEAYEELLQRIQLHSPRRINPMYYYISGMAAVILLVVSGYFFLRGPRPAPPLIYSTVKGQSTHFLLPDGSRVWLNAGSRLSYTDRKAVLEGEAYFEIAPNKSVPFDLSAGGTETVVLGTSFNVKAYPDESSVDISLIQGSIRVKLGNKSMTLLPGQTALARANDLVKRDNDTASALAWKEGFFYFNSTLDEVARELAHWYDIDITLEKGAMFKDTVKVRAPRDLPIDSLVRLLEDIGAGHFKLEGRTLDVRP